MGFRELIEKVRLESGLSDEESKDALEMMVESLAVHLTEAERKDFASQLPEELQDIALAVLPTEQTATQGILQQFMEMEHITESRAKRHIKAAWQAIKQTVSAGEISHIRAQLSKQNATLLH